MSTANRASIRLHLGASGSGKSLGVKQLLARVRGSLLIWDPQAEYDACPVYASRRALLDALKSQGRAPYRATLRPGHDLAAYPAAFAWTCRLAYQLAGCTFVAEELADVTTPSRAPPEWSMIVRKGRHQGLSVIGLSQRPASIDKDIWGNATVIRSGRLVYRRDADVVASALDIAPAELLALPPLHWIERDMQSGKLTRGTTTPPAAPARGARSRPM